MESLIRGELSHAAKNLGVAVPSARFDEAVAVALCAVAEGRDYDLAVEVARSVLHKGSQIPVAA